VVPSREASARPLNLRLQRLEELCALFAVIDLM
jgi:hypothetical protein